MSKGSSQQCDVYHIHCASPTATTRSDRRGAQAVVIYHLTSESDLRRYTKARIYRPPSLDSEGFVHCSDAASVLPVADDYFGDASAPMLLLEIDAGALAAEVRVEAPAPLPGGGTAHLTPGAAFPHVYGPIEVTAVRRLGWLRRGPAGYAWPPDWLDPEAFLSA